MSTRYRFPPWRSRSRGGREAKPAVKPLVALVEGRARYRCARAAEALGRIGPEASAVMVPLADALKDRNADVGVATAFLAHDAARLITGETLYIDGGYHIMD